MVRVVAVAHRQCAVRWRGLLHSGCTPFRV